MERPPRFGGLFTLFVTIARTESFRQEKRLRPRLLRIAEPIEFATTAHEKSFREKLELNRKRRPRRKQKRVPISYHPPEMRRTSPVTYSASAR